MYLARSEKFALMVIDGEAMVIDDQAHITRIGDVSFRIWQLLDTPKPRAALLETLGTEYWVDGDECERLVSPVLGGMLRRGLLLEWSPEPQ